MTAYLYGARPIPADPWLVQTVNATVKDFLDALPAPDFRVLADAEALWAAPADAEGEGSVIGTIGTVSSYVVSAAAHRRIKAHRFS